MILVDVNLLLYAAALAIEYGHTAYFTDNDFKRFEGLRHNNPLAVQ